MKQTVARLRNIVIALAVVSLGMVILAGPSTAAGQGGQGQQTCDDLGYTKGSSEDRSSGNQDYDFGNLTWSGSTLTYRISGGYSVEICLKAGSDQSSEQPIVESGPLAGPTSGTVSTGGKQISHIGYRSTVTTSKDASASVSTTPATCEAGEELVYGPIEHATFTGTADGTRGPGSYSVTATADAGHAFPDGGATRTFNGELDGPLTGQQCEPPLVEDASASVSTTPATCQSGETLVYGTIENATFSGTPNGTEGPESYSVTATAVDGHAFPGGDATRTFNGVLDGPVTSSDCQPLEEDASASVSTTPATCEVGETLVYGAIRNATFSGTANGTHGPGSYSVVATADEGHAFPGGDTTELFEGSLAGPLSGAQCEPPPECPGGDMNGPDNPGCDRPDMPEPTTEQVPGSETGCDLEGPNGEIGGTHEWVDEWTTTWVYDQVDHEWDPVVTGPVRISDTFTPFTDDEYFAQCAPPQPPDEVRQLSGSDESCELGGEEIWADTFVTPYVWNAETRSWEPGVETVVHEEEFLPWSEGKIDRLCSEDPEIAGEQEDKDPPKGHHPGDGPGDPEVKGAQAVVPTAVNAGLGEQSRAVRRNPLWLLAVGGGIGLMGFAGRRRRVAVSR